MIVLWILLGLLGFLLLALLAIGLVFYGIAIPRNAWIHASAHNPTPEEKRVWEENKAKAEERKQTILAMDAEIWHLTAHDGLQLQARFIPAENAKGTVICCHGYRSAAVWDFGISAPFLHENGYNLLLIDQRGHGESQGKFVCYGTLERFDVSLWCRMAEEKTHLPIWLYGISMGCATVLFTLGQELPPSVKGVIADCGYTSPEAVFRHLLQDTFHLPPKPIMPFAGFWVRLLAGWDIRLSTLPIMAQNKLPILFICGTADNFVPTRMTLANYNACTAPKKLLLAEGAGHAQSMNYIPEEYEAAVKALLEGRI